MHRKVLKLLPSIQIYFAVDNNNQLLKFSRVNVKYCFFNIYASYLLQIESSKLANTQHFSYNNKNYVTSIVT